MAITNAIMQMRRGLEADFDPDKMKPGEWAVSTDEKYVRMCFSVGVCVRMATYDAFEKDMEQIEEILSTCETIEEAVSKINTEVSANAKAVAEYTEQAKKYRDEAKAFRDEAESIAGIGVATKDKAGIVKPDGTTITVDEDGTIHASEGTTDYEDLENKPQIEGVELSGNKTLSELGIASADDLEETNSKVDIIIEKAELNIKNTAKGDNLHLTDSANSRVVEFGLYGKSEQKQYSGKNLLQNMATTQTVNGVTFTVNEDGSVTLNGTATANATIDIGTFIPVVGVSYKYSTLVMYTHDEYLCYLQNVNGKSQWRNNNYQFTAETADTIECKIYVASGITLPVDFTFYPMIRLASDTDDTYEPYVGGIASPNPEYPQEITVSGSDGSVEVVSCRKNLLKNTATTQTKGGIAFTVNNDGSINITGTETSGTNNGIMLTNTLVLPKGKYIISHNYSGSYSTIWMFVRNKDTNSSILDVLSSEKIVDLTEDTTIQVNIYVKAGVTINSATLYPMIRLASDTDSTYEPYKETVSTIPTPNGLCGIKVSSGGNYTDENGQQWICDEVVKYADGSGKRVQRIGVIDSYNGESVTTDYMSTTGQLTTGAKVLYVLPEPIITDLTAEEIAEIEKLYTFYPITNISNDSDCGMSIKYLCDSKNYIDNRLAQIEAVLINNI